MLVDGAERLVLDELPAKLGGQTYMWQREQGVDGEDARRSSGWRPIVQWSCSRLGTVDNRLDG